MAKGASASISEGSSTRKSEKGSSTDRRSRKTLPYGSTTGIATSSAIAMDQRLVQPRIVENTRAGEEAPPIDLTARGPARKFGDQLDVVDVLGMPIELHDRRRLGPRSYCDAVRARRPVRDHVVRRIYEDGAGRRARKTVLAEDGLYVAALRDPDGDHPGTSRHSEAGLAVHRCVWRVVGLGGAKHPTRAGRGRECVALGHGWSQPWSRRLRRPRGRIDVGGCDW